MHFLLHGEVIIWQQGLWMLKYDVHLKVTGQICGRKSC